MDSSRMTLKSECLQILSDHSDDNSQWGEWLLVDPGSGIVNVALRPELRRFIEDHALPVVRGERWTDAAYRAAFQRSDREWSHHPFSVAASAANWAVYSRATPKWDTGDTARHAARHAGLSRLGRDHEFWPRFRARLGLDVDADGHRPFLEETLDSGDEASMLVYADWLEDRGDPRADQWRVTARDFVDRGTNVRRRRVGRKASTIRPAMSV